MKTFKKLINLKKTKQKNKSKKNKMIKPLLIDKRLDVSFLNEDQSILINVNEINLIECRKAIMIQEIEKEVEETKNTEDDLNLNLEKNIQDQEHEQKEKQIVKEKIEIEGWATNVHTKSSPVERFSFFTPEPDLEWLKRNCKNIGMSKLHELDNSLLFVNKNNIIDISFKKKKDESGEYKEADLILFFQVNPVEKTDESGNIIYKDAYDNIMPYPIEMSNIKQELRNENAYTIIKEFLDSI